MIPDRWLRIAVPARDEVARDLIADVLIQLGGRAVVEEGSDLVTYVPPPDDLQEFLEGAFETVGAVKGSGAVSWDWQPHEDWASAWRHGLAPRRIGERILVTPTWIEPPVRRGDVVVRIDPGMAFGTAEHATTRLALRFLERAVSKGDAVLDVGTGSGILAIAAVGLGATRVAALDNDPLACDQATENIVRNGVSSRVHVALRSVAPEDRMGRFDGVVANIVSGVLLPLAPALAHSLGPGGWFVASGVEEVEAARALEALRAVGLEPVEVGVEDGWWGGWFRKRGSGHKGVA